MLTGILNNDLFCIIINVIFLRSMSVVNVVEVCVVGVFKPHVALGWKLWFVLSENLGCTAMFLLQLAMKNFNAVPVAFQMPIIPFSHLTTQTLLNKSKIIKKIIIIPDTGKQQTTRAHYKPNTWTYSPQPSFVKNMGKPSCSWLKLGTLVIFQFTAGARLAKTLPNCHQYRS